MTLNWASNQTQQRARTWTDPPGLIRGIRKRFWAVKEPTHRQCEKKRRRIISSLFTSLVHIQRFLGNVSRETPLKSHSTQLSRGEHDGAFSSWRDISHRSRRRPKTERTEREYHTHDSKLNTYDRVVLSLQDVEVCDSLINFNTHYVKGI